MKRRPWKVFKVVMFLLLLIAGGVIVNVAVAWGCAMLLNPFDWPQGAFGTDVKRTEYDHWSGYRNDVQGAHVRMYTPRSGLYLHDAPATPWLHHWRAPWEPTDELNSSVKTIFDARGWPSVAMWSQLQINWPQSKCVRGIQTGTVVLIRPNGLRIPRCLPTCMIWPGFAINSMFYAGVLWMVFAFPFVVRRRRRIKRGLCPACAYPVGSSPVCTECGKALR